MKSTSSKRLNELIEHFGITQTDLSKKTGIPKSAISMYVSGQRKPKQDRISDIAEAYGVNEAWLMGYDVEMKKEFSEEEGLKSSEFLYKFSILKSRDKELILEIMDSMINKHNESGE